VDEPGIANTSRPISGANRAVISTQSALPLLQSSAARQPRDNRFRCGKFAGRPAGNEFHFRPDRAVSSHLLRQRKGAAAVDEAAHRSLTAIVPPGPLSPPRMRRAIYTQREPRHIGAQHPKELARSAASSCLAAFCAPAADERTARA